MTNSTMNITQAKKGEMTNSLTILVREKSGHLTPNLIEIGIYPQFALNVDLLRKKKVGVTHEKMGI